MKSTHALAVATATVAGLGLASAADAAPTPPTRIFLTITSGATGDVKEVYLGCGPTGGNHPQAEVACTALDDAGGDFDRLKGGDADVMCPMVYEPVVAEAQGTFDNVPVGWKKTFGNTCELNAKTGTVFAF
ncbi:subtilase-type protease inhibitor [Streptomyces sp. Je 1-79]|uniref:subtilase-type protease inhibitor n=1 Tax=Streptomyces sp. Je 1-79 TaxID=2943847 RepID=UPI0021A46103|nr:subtilase-type protease inhibitor [Streptomyces sp. Je 1-79]MCT4357690.1 subtilase-type protease inhibitor [Streptomyces sp. Je 1-79]